MTDTAREPVAHLWQHKETGRVYYQGPHDEAPQRTYMRIGPLFLEPRAIPPREPTEAMIRAAWKEVFDHTNGSNHLFDSGVPAIWRAMYDAALAEKEGK